MFSLSTSCIEVPKPPDAMLEELRSLAGGAIDAISLDSRIPLEVKREVARAAPSRGFRVVQMALAESSRSPSPISEYRDERRRSAANAVQAVELAGQWDMAHIGLGPWLIPSIADLRPLTADYIVGKTISTDTIKERRLARAAEILDRIRALLDVALARADALGRRIILTAPCPLIWAAPNGSELELLRQEFAGAPLDVQLRLDWAHQRVSLEGGSHGVDADIPPNFERLVVADACGLEGGLPFGCGELNALRHLKSDRIGSYPVLFAFQPGIRGTEVLQSLTRWSALREA
jgi:hypothetical protein